MSTTAAFLAAKLYQRWSPIRPEQAATAAAAPDPERSGTTGPSVPGGADVGLTGAEDAYPTWVSVTVLASVLGVIPLGIFYGRAIAPWVIPGLMVLLLSFGVARRVRVYEILVDGAREGFQVALRIIPYLVAILVAVAMFRASGALEVLVAWLAPATSLVGPARGSTADGAAPPAVRVGRLRCVGGDHRGPGHRSRQLYRISGEHVSGFDRDDVLRTGGCISERYKRVASVTRLRPR